MFSSVDSPASMITVGSGVAAWPRRRGTRSFCKAAARVPGSEMLPGSTSLRSGKPDSSSDRPRVTQGAVIAALLGAPELQVAAGAAVIVDVGEVDEDQGGVGFEQGALAPAEGVFPGVAVAPEQVGGAVELVEGKRAGAFEAEQLEGGGAGVEPVAGGALGGGLEHAGEDEGGGDAGVAGGGAGGFESVAESELVEGVEGEALGADGADVGVVEGVEVDGGEVVAGMEGAALEEAAVDALGEGEQWGVGRFEGKLGGIAVEDELDELGPALGRDIKVGTEVEEVDLAGAGVGADIADEAEGAVGAAGGAVAGSDLADEHGPSMGGGGRP